MLPSYCMAGRCRPYCAIWRAELSYISGIARLRKTECVNNCTAAKWPSMAPYRGASGLAIRVYSIPWPPSCPGALPTRCTIEGAPLLAFAVDAAIQDALWRQSHTCTRQRRGLHRDRTEEAMDTAMVYGSSSIHSPAFSATWSEVRRWPTTTARATVPCRELTATWCCSLEPLVPQTVLRQ